METIDDMRCRHYGDEAFLVRRALEQSGWRQTRAAVALGVAISTMQSLIAKHPDIRAEIDARSPRPGRPKKTNSHVDCC